MESPVTQALFKMIKETKQMTLQYPSCSSASCLLDTTIRPGHSLQVAPTSSMDCKITLLGNWEGATYAKEAWKEAVFISAAGSPLII